MSVTFWCPNAPSKRERVPCDSQENYGLTCTPEDRCGYCDDGWLDERTTDCPEVNWSNQNAGDVLRLLGLYNPEGLWGEMAVAEIPAVLQRILLVSNKASSRQHLVRETTDTQNVRTRIAVGDDGLPTITTTGPRVIDFGNTDDQTLRRLGQLRTLLVWAEEHGFDVSWG